MVAVSMVCAVLVVAACRSAASAQVTPTGRPPYRVGAVTVTTPSVSLAGTVTVPEGPGPFPAIVIASVGGPADQDLPLADALTRRDMIVLRVDGRGTGLSTGDAVTAGREALADDVVALVARIATHPAVNPARIGVLGRGDAAVVAAVAAGRSPTVAFVVSLAGGTAFDAVRPQVTVPVFARPTDPVARPSLLADVMAELAVWIGERRAH